MAAVVSRRGFLQATAAVAGAAPAALAVAASTTAIPTLPPVPTAPAFEPNWRWFAGNDPEWLGETNAKTKEEAIQEAAKYGYRYVTEAHLDIAGCPLVWDSQDIWDAIANMEDNSGGLSTEGESFDSVPDEDIEDLVRRLNEATRAWFIERDIRSKLHVDLFQGIREEIDLGEEPAPLIAEGRS
jgi:hypothetical protein